MHTLSLLLKMKHRLSKLEKCPYVIGVTIDLSKDKIKGYCSLRDEMCERILNYKSCRDYRKEQTR